MSGNSSFVSIKFDTLSELNKLKVEAKLSEFESQHIKNFYDYCVFHSEHDQPAVLAFRQAFDKRFDLKGCLECDAELMKELDKIQRTEEMVKRSSFVLVYVTNHFNNDTLCKIQKSDLLCRYNKDLKLVLVFPTKNSQKLMPVGLGGFSEIKWFLKNRDKLRVDAIFTESAKKICEHKQKAETFEWEITMAKLRENESKKLAGCRVQRYFSDDSVNVGGSSGYEADSEASSICSSLADVQIADQVRGLPRG